MFLSPIRSRRAILLSTCLGLSVPTVAVAADTTISTPTTSGQSVTGTDTLTVTGAGSIGVPSSRAVTITGSSTGVVITNDGTIASGSGRAIDTNSAGTTQTLTINNTGTISGGDDAIRINTDITSGTVRLTNSGTIVSASGQAIDFDAIASGAATVIITNTATGVIQSNGQDAIRPGAGGTVINAGTIFSTGAAGNSYDGIDFQAHAGTVINEAGGVISGLRHGITTDSNVAVTNNGSITGRNGSGVGSDGDGLVINYGTITGAYAGTGNGDGDGVDIDFNATIVNYGIIQGTGAGGVDSGGATNHSEGIAAGGGSITNHAGALISGGDTAILIDDGAGNGAYSATTITNAGTIQGLAGYGIRLIGNYDDTITNSGTIHGGNGIAIDMGGGNDTLNLITGSIITGAILGGEGTDTITLSGTGSGTLANTSGFEVLNILGGTWTLTGTQAYSGGATIAAGATGMVEGTLDNQVAVLAGGRLGGNGSIGSLDAYGTVFGGSGSNFGTLRVGGNATFRAGSSYEVRVNAGGQNSLLAIAGAATLQGGTVSVLAQNGLYAWRSGYTILTAAGGVSGRFDGVTSNLAFLTPSLGYSANAVSLTLTRNDVAFPATGATANQRAVGAAISAGGGSSTLYNAIVTQSADGARRSFERLSGEAHAGLGGALLQQQMLSSRIVTDRLRQAGGAAVNLLAFGRGVQFASTGPASDAGPGLPISPYGLEVWGTFIGGGGRIDGDGNASRLTQNHMTFMAGIDGVLGAGWRLGLAIGHTEGTVKSDATGSRSTTRSLLADLYAGGPIGPLQLRGALGVSFHDIESRRSVVAGSFQDAPRADYDGHDLHGLAEVAYPLAIGALAVEPYAGLGFSSLHLDGFTEQGGAASLTAASRAEDRLWSEMGLRLSTRLPLGSDMVLVPQLGLGWQHAFGDTDQSLAMSFRDTGASFTTRGAPLARDTAVIQAGVSVTVADQLDLRVGYVGAVADGATDHSGRVNLTWRF